MVWLTAAANFDGNPTAVDSVCGAGCFHGFHSDVSRAYGFRVEDKASCEPTFCVSGVKFNDANGNGIPDAGELGLPGVEIRVTSEKGSVLSALTGADGSYRICGLTDDVAYRVTETLPFGYSQTGPVNRDISRFVHARGSAFIIDLCDEDIARPQFREPAHPQCHRRNQVRGLERQRRSRSRRAASGRRHDRSDPGPAAGCADDSSTDASGNFLFTGVAAGSYVLTEVVPAGFSETVPATDGIPVTLVSGGSSINNVFGNFHGILTGTVSGLKFNDLNGNGVRDAGEPGLSGVTITLSLTGTTPRTVVTGFRRHLLLLGAVPFGSYTVSETVPAGFQQNGTRAAPGTLTALVDFGHQAVAGARVREPGSDRHDLRLEVQRLERQWSPGYRRTGALGRHDPVAQRCGPDHHGNDGCLRQLLLDGSRPGDLTPFPRSCPSGSSRRRREARGRSASP